MQTRLQADPNNLNLIAEEKHTLQMVRHWRKIDGISLQQKSSVTWLKYGDESTVYFHVAIKERQASNGIYDFWDSEGNHLTDQKDIEEEIVGFYKKLQGTVANNLRDIDRVSMRKGSQL